MPLTQVLPRLRPPHALVGIIIAHDSSPPLSHSFPNVFPSLCSSFLLIYWLFSSHHSPYTFSYLSFLLHLLIAPPGLHISHLPYSFSLLLYLASYLVKHIYKHEDDRLGKPKRPFAYYGHSNLCRLWQRSKVQKILSIHSRVHGPMLWVPTLWLTLQRYRLNSRRLLLYSNRNFLRLQKRQSQLLSPRWHSKLPTPPSRVCCPHSLPRSRDAIRVAQNRSRVYQTKGNEHGLQIQYWVLDLQRACLVHVLQRKESWVRHKASDDREWFGCVEADADSVCWSWCAACCSKVWGWWPYVP